MSNTMTERLQASTLPVAPFQPTLEASQQISSAPGVPVSHLLNKLDAAPAPPPAAPVPQTHTPRAEDREDTITDSDIDGLVRVVDTPVDILIDQTIQRLVAEHEEDAFFVGDLSSVYDAVQTWRKSPLGERVEIFYAVKCNPSPAVLHLLSLLGTSFDCASIAEINAVLSLPSAPSPERIIFANPCKPASFIRAASRAGVKAMTFDNADELHKIARLHPGARLVLRILTDDSKSLCRLGLKYGAPLDTCPGLLALARSLGLNVVGVSFHVGSGCKDPDQFRDAVWRARRVFDMGAAAGYTFDFLDVGGGFESEHFEQMSRVLSESLDHWFPASEGVRVVAEPGRFMVSSAFTLATSIIARRRALSAREQATTSDVQEVQKSAEAGIAACAAEGAAEGEGADVMYYINDGVYGSFNCILFDHQIVHPYPLTIAHAPASFPGSACIPRHPGPLAPPNIHFPAALSLTRQLGYQPRVGAGVENASVWGPTCDSIDCVRELVELPAGLQVGDWLGWGEMGAYTLCAASTFNGFSRSDVLYTTGGEHDSARAVRALLDGFAGGMA